MKVLVISHMYPSGFNTVGGIFVHEQVKALVRNGVEIKVISPIPWTPFPTAHLTAKWREYNAVPDQAIWEEIEVYYPRYLNFPRGWFFSYSGRQLYRGIRDIARKIDDQWGFDLIHAHVALPDGYAARLLGEELGRSFVLTIHGQDLQRTITKTARQYRAVKYAIQSASKVILVSNKLYRIAFDRFGCEQNLVVIPNGVDPAKIHSAKTPTQSSLDTPVILSVSNLVHTKGLDLNLRAMQRLASKYGDLKYVAVGEGPQRAVLSRLVHELDLEEKVVLRGQLSHHEAMQQMASCQIFSLPSWNEGFGVAYIEAMAHGKPIIACRGEGISDVVIDGDTGILVEPDNVESLIEALDFLLSHPDKAQAMGERARNLVLENYTWDKNADQMIQVYKEVLGGG